MALTMEREQALPLPGRQMPLLGHLRELRDRLLRAVIAVAVGIVAGIAFGSNFERLLLAPAGPNFHPVAIDLLENMTVYFKISLTFGIIMAMPYLVYQLFAFLAPGLTSKEKRMILTLLPAIVFMFALGISFGYFIALPPALNFLYHFNASVATPMVRISNYMDVVTQLLLAIGLVFEAPIVVMVLARLGIVSPQWLSKRRKIWIVLAFVIAAIITPTPDPINQSIVAVPLILLLELSIILARIVYKKKREVPAEA